MKAHSIDILIENSVAPDRAMEIDLELLSQYHSSDTSLFRLYHWCRPTISLGRLQKIDNTLNLSRIEQDSISVVTRPSGGRHVLHGEDISFSLIIPSKNVPFWGSKVSERSRSIAQFFQSILNSFGVRLDIENEIVARSTMIKNRKSACYLTTTQNELTVDGKKLIGIAQLVTGDAVLIQGTVPLTTHYRTITQYQQGDSSTLEYECGELAQKTTSLDKLLPSEYSLDFDCLTRKMVDSVKSNTSFAVRHILGE